MLHVLAHCSPRSLLAYAFRERQRMAAAVGASLRPERWDRLLALAALSAFLPHATVSLLALRLFWRLHPGLVASYMVLSLWPTFAALRDAALVAQSAWFGLRAAVRPPSGADADGSPPPRLLRRLRVAAAAGAVATGHGLFAFTRAELARASGSFLLHITGVPLFPRLVPPRPRAYALHRPCLKPASLVEVHIVPPPPDAPNLSSCCCAAFYFVPRAILASNFVLLLFLGPLVSCFALLRAALMSRRSPALRAAVEARIASLVPATICRLLLIIAMRPSSGENTADLERQIEANVQSLQAVFGGRSLRQIAALILSHALFGDRRAFTQDLASALGSVAAHVGPQPPALAPPANLQPLELPDEIDGDEAPEHFKCAISRSLMLAPAFVASSGFSYDHSFITQWVQQHGTDPITRAPASTDMIIPNLSLRSLIRDWIDNQSRRLSAGAQGQNTGAAGAAAEGPSGRPSDPGAAAAGALAEGAEEGAEGGPRAARQRRRAGITSRSPSPRGRPAGRRGAR